MRSYGHALTAALACGAWLSLVRCSSEPVAGGTETGNPEVTACVMLTFDALDDSAAWNVRTYVPGGMDRLDSCGIVTGSAYRHPSGTLAKRWVERQDSTAGGVRYVTYTLYIDDTLLVRRTLYVTDTLYVNDTLVSVDTVRDTAFVVESGDTTRIVRVRLDIDSVFVVDTVYLPDTLFSADTIFVRDTVVFHDTLNLYSTGTADTQFSIPSESLNVVYARDAYVRMPAADMVSLEYSRVKGAQYVVSPAASGFLVTFSVSVPPQNYLVLNETATALIAKKLVTSWGAVIAEEFGDLDGDGVLFGPGRQKVRYLHTYAYQADSVFAAADFDAGADGSFATTGDNVLTTVLRRTQTRRRLENVTYAYDPSTAMSDTLALQLFEVLQDSSLEWCTRTYTLRRGRDVRWGNDDSLLGWRGSAIYNRGDIRRMDMLVRPDAAVPRGQPLAGAWLEATVWMADGGVGQLSARLDVSAGTVRGTYRRDGVTYDIALDRRGIALW